MTSVLQYRDPISCRNGFPMNTPTFPHSASPMATAMKKSPQYEGNSSGSDTRKPQTPGAKRRPSRAGTRSVSTLTAAQLERKRANDREAQRAIRQRTKDHIENLERQIADLSAQQNPNASMVMELRRRNEELEQENAVLRSRLSQAVTALGVPDSNSGNVIPGPDATGMLSATGSAPSPSDRVQMLSQPRRLSSGTARSVHSVPDATTPVSQPGHWQAQHPAYATNASSPHIEAPPPMNDVYASHGQHPVSMAVQDPSLHAMDSGNQYPYPIDTQTARSMSYPLEGSQVMASQQPMQSMSGYGTPTSNPSPHPQEYQRHMSVPMNAPPPHHPQHMQQQQQPSGPYQAFPGHPQQQNFVPQVSHPSEMHMMAQAPQPHPQMMGDQGHMVYHMKVEQH